ncbi:hypothetical protein KDX27_35760 [Burkholderia cenocepacia]|uniref:hypothetical protein n=1 Tax=Burkholderia cenocepacia TaxID=95486 RepID=UPI000398B7CA|nr:hypothetical protein [Burkholderia cenocepacia]ERJ38631.1 hypothetical protein L810_6848 [Burkholderia sp. AU4i]MBR8173090.1 hypothetical protein [Burkholderia cenocepacia]
MGKLERRKVKGWWRYHREDVRACAREYWKTQRFTRPTDPEWLKVELVSGRYELPVGVITPLCGLCRFH